MNTGAKFFAFGGTAGGSGDVVGPASATDNGVVVYDGTTGKLLGTSLVVIDGGDVSGVTALSTENMTLPSDGALSFGDNAEVVMAYDTTDADAFGFKVGLPAATGNDTGYFMIGARADIIGQDLGLQTGDSYVFVAVEAGGATMAGLGPIDGVVTLVGVGTKSLQFFNPASGVVFSVASDGTDTTITPESGTELALAGIVKASSGVRGKHSTANVTNPPTDAELDSAFGTPATVGAGFTATLDDAGGGTAMYSVASDGTNWWYTLMTKAV